MRLTSRLPLFLLAFSLICQAQQLPAFTHVFVVLEENANYNSVIGNPAMPYLNNLASTYGLATQYYANTHPSIGNYFMLTTGQIITNNDGFNGVVTADNVVAHLLAAGKTWKAYEESIPYPGYFTPDTSLYARRHCPLSYFPVVIGNARQQLNLVPFTQFAKDLANNSFPDYSFITPNLCNDAHNCPLGTADTWLQTNIDPLIKSPGFQDGGLLIIVFDESGNDNSHGGGLVAWIAVSPKYSKLHYQSTTYYQHPSTLRLMMQGLGLTTYPGAAKTAPDMAEFFNP